MSWFTYDSQWLSDNYDNPVFTIITPITVVNEPIRYGVKDNSLYRIWQTAVNNYFRQKIPRVPGVGNVLGVWCYKNTYYAFRSDGTKVVMYYGNVAGWEPVKLFKQMKFDAGTLADGDLAEGDTITGVTSGATGVVKKFVKWAGSYSVDASGYIVVDTDGTFLDNETIQKGSTNLFTADGDSFQIEFAVNENKFQFVNYNYYATTDYFKMYGCDGVNPAFEFDGETLTPILLPSLPEAPFENKPIYIEAHKNYLWLAFRGGDLQCSVLGEPCLFSGFLGSAEFGLGSEIKGMKSVLDNALIISTEHQISGMYGSTIDDFQLKILSADTSGIDRTCAVSVRPYLLTKKGIIRLDPTQAFGNFQSGSVSRLITPLLNDYIVRKGIVGAGISRSLNQYRLYFDDGTGIILTQDALYADQNLPQFTTFSYKHPPTCISSVNVDDFNEVLLFGDKDGYIYRENVSNNCDGQNMEFALRTPFINLGSSSIRKRFKRAEFAVNGSGDSDIAFSYELSYGDLGTERTSAVDVTAVGAGGYWGTGRWGEMTWSAPLIDNQIQSITGNGTNISLLFYGDSDMSDSFTINGVTLHHAPSRLNRG
jgi:hypothetical protein